MAVSIVRRWIVLQGMASLLASTAAWAQAELSEAELAGVWRGYVKDAGFRINGELIFRRNGTYQRMHQLGQLMTWASGPYRIAENWIHFEVEDYESKRYLGVDQAPPPSETWMVDYFDGRQIEGRIGNSAQFSYRKAD